jgi:DNA-binding transcriptional regulator YiaG
MDGTRRKASQQTRASMVPNVKGIPRHPDLSHDKLGSMCQKSEIPSEAIKQFRESKGLSQQQFASMLNVGVASLSRWENGAKKPTGTAAAVLSALVGGSRVAGLTGSGYAIYRLLKDCFGDES